MPMSNEVAEAFEAAVEEAQRHVGTRFMLWFLAAAVSYFVYRAF